jgi:hypothetical protein
MWLVNRTRIGGTLLIYELALNQSEVLLACHRSG